MTKNPVDRDLMKKIDMIAMKGLSTWLDPMFIEDQECPDMSNIHFEAGVASPRKGTKKIYGKPTGETLSPLQSMVFKTSDGMELLVNVFGNNFYVIDESLNKWILLNDDYSPAQLDKRYGFASWNGGITNDRGYFCNGYDNAARWTMFIGHTTVGLTAISTTITVDDATRLTIPKFTISSVDTGADTVTVTAHSFKTGDRIVYKTSGTTITGLTDSTDYFAIKIDANKIALALTSADALAGTKIDLTGAGTGTQTISKGVRVVVYDGTTRVVKTAYDKTGNVLTLSTAFGSVIGAGASITPAMEQKSTIPKGRILAKYKRRLVTLNGYQTETNVNYGVTNDPEDFTLGAGPTDGGIFSISDGEGPINGGVDFGTFFLIMKSSNLMSLTVDLADDNTTKIEKLTPLISGDSMGPLSVGSTIKFGNSVIYPSEQNGIYQLSPAQTGVSSTTDVKILTSKLQNYLRSVSFYESHVSASNQKIYYLCATGEVNNMILVIDLNKGAITKFNNMPAADIFTYGTELHYLSRVTGETFQANTGRADDNKPYQAYFFTKRWDFGAVVPKSVDALYVEGYISRGNPLFVDVMFNENGTLAKRTYKIEYETKNITASIVSGAFSEFDMAVMPLDLTEEEDVANFRGYLSLPNGKGFYSIEAKFYGVINGNTWGISTVGFNPMPENNIPPLLRISPIE